MEKLRRAVFCGLLSCFSRLILVRFDFNGLSVRVQDLLDLFLYLLAYLVNLSWPSSLYAEVAN